MNPINRPVFVFLVVGLFCFWLAGCGSGTGSTSITPTLPFTETMISNNQFVDSLSGSLLTFNSEGTFTDAVINADTGTGSTSTGTWSINSSGQLVAGNSTYSQFYGSTLANGLFYSEVNTDGTTNTGTLYLVTSNGFTSAVLSGNTFKDSNGGGTLTFNANGSFTSSEFASTNMTWTIINGQLFIKNAGLSGTGTSIITLLSGATTSGLNYCSINSDGSNPIGTLTLVSPATAS
jgi:hypothetical protein